MHIYNWKAISRYYIEIIIIIIRAIQFETEW